MIDNNISVVVPVYNQERYLEGNITKLHKLLSNLFKTYELIIVESGSTDNSGKIVDNLVKRLKNIIVIHQGKKLGYGNGLREGYRKARYDLVWYVDPDCPYDIEVLKNALPLITNADAVIGVRYGKRLSLLRAVTAKVYNFIIRLFLRVPFRDINFSFKILKRTALKKLDLRCDGWFIDGEILAELRRNKCKVIEMPVPLNGEGQDYSTLNVGIGLYYELLRDMFKYLFRKKKQY